MSLEAEQIVVVLDAVPTSDDCHRGSAARALLLEAAALGALNSAVERLAESAAWQRRRLAGLGVGPQVDELALEFDDRHRPLGPALGAASPEAAAACGFLSRALSDHALGWTVDDLESAAWMEVRRLAASAAAALRDRWPHLPK